MVDDQTLVENVEASSSAEVIRFSNKEMDINVKIYNYDRTKDNPYLLVTAGEDFDGIKVGTKFYNENLENVYGQKTILLHLATGSKARLYYPEVKPGTIIEITNNNQSAFDKQRFPDIEEFLSLAYYEGSFFSDQK